MPHIHEHYDFVVAVFIVHKDKVLLVRHKKFNAWLPIGGHIELNEEPDEALFREIEEESGLLKEDIEILNEKPKEQFSGRKFLFTPSFLEVHPIGDKHNHTSLVYFARSRTGAVRLADGEHHEIKWFDENAFKDESHHWLPGIQFFAQEAFQRAGKKK